MTLVNVAGTFSLAIAFAVMSLTTPMNDLQMVFLGVQSSGSAPWVGSFTGSIRTVYYLSTLFLLVAIVPSVMRGKAGNSVHGRNATST
jgi:hypothetical protein